MKYKCNICGYIYDEEKESVLYKDLTDDYVCPWCMVKKSDCFELIEEEKEKVKTEEKSKFKNAIEISKDNIAIEKDDELCVDCGQCKNICESREGLKDIKKGLACVNCGQCIGVCPVGAITPKNDIEKFNEMKKSGKKLVAFTSPAVRVAIGDELGLEKGSFAQGKLVAALRKIGFDYVLDTTFGADLTIMEEATELISRITEKKTLPMFTSCCPAWVKYAEDNYPEVLKNISTCKSPIGMQGLMIKKYFAPNVSLTENDIYAVAITPCTAKKYEIKREEIKGTDLVLTTRELISIIKNSDIDFLNLEDMDYDSLFKEGSGAGMIFGASGGVTEAAIRTAYNMLTNKELENLEFTSVRGLDNVKEASVKIDDLILNIAVINQMSSALPILEDVKNNTSKYHFIEIMNCFGGCIGGGGQPKVQGDEKEVKEKRINSLYKKDESSCIRCSHLNEDIIKIYDNYLEKPGSDIAKELLHTSYTERV